MKPSALLDILSEYEKQNIADITCGKAYLRIHHFSETEVRFLISKSSVFFSSEPMVLRLDLPCVIIGDIHGSLIDLLRIVQRNGRPASDNKYLFLGDIVDNGPFSLDTLAFVLMLKVSFPESVFLIRGDHEFAETKCTTNSFDQSVKQAYQDSDLLSVFHMMFQKLPLAAVLDGAVFCVHGGIGPSLKHLDNLAYLAKPVKSDENSVIEEILWSDPMNSLTNFSVNRTRGHGSCFNNAALTHFLKENNLEMLVRGHEVRTGGVGIEFDGKLVTVFSASNYLGHGNQSGVFYMRSRSEYETRRYEPLAGRIKVELITTTHSQLARRQTPKTMSTNDLRKCSRYSGCLLTKLALKAPVKKTSDSKLLC